MTLGHPRSTSDTRISAGTLQSPESNFPNPFDASGFVAQFLKRFGSDAEARLGKAILKELEALSKEGDPELFWDEALRLAGRLERGERLDASAALFQEVAQATAAGFPELSARAEGNMQAIAGEGKTGARFEFLLRRFARETRDPWMIVGFGAGSLAYRTTKFAALSKLWNPGRGFFLGRTGAGLLASAAGLSVETPAFLFSSKLGRQLGGLPQDWSRETLAHELAGVGLTLLCLKSMGGLSGKATSGLGRFAGAAAPQAGMLTGIALARRLEETLGLKPRVDNATFFTDTLSTYLQFFVSGRLAERAFGPRFQALQAAFNWRRPSPSESGGRAFPGLSLATPAPTVGRQGTPPGSSIQELMQAPSLSGSYDDGGDGKNSESLPYGYGNDTIMGMWFPSQAKPSNAVPIFTSAIDQVPQMLRSAYRHRPDRQHPRTILLEPSLGALQQISPKAAVIPQLLNSLTKGTGEQFPEKTPFRIMQMAERRTFVAKVTDRRLTWSEENDPTWARINRHSVSNEFEAESPLELYLYIESLTRQPRPSPETDYLVRYRGRSPASYGTTLEKFIERSLKFYRIVGRSFSIEFGDGQAAQRFITSNEDWMIEESGMGALSKPAAAAPLESELKSTDSPRPVFPKERSLTTSKKAPAVSPFSVITSFQALKDVGGLLSDPSLPRRIELWLEVPTNALLESGVWQQVFKDLRPGSILVIHESQTRKSFTFQRREDQVLPRSAPWSRPLAWESGLRLSSRDVIDLLQQLQFIANTKTVKDQSLTVSILGDWEPYHGKMLTNLINQWGNIPFEEIEIQAPRLSSDVLLRLRRNHVGKFIEVEK